MNFRRPLLFTLGAIILVAAGCQIVPEAKPDPTRFFLLTDPAPLPPESASSPSADGVTLGLHRVRLPVYLSDSRAIAVSQSGNRITYRDFDRWAEPLDAGVERVLRSGLVRSASVTRVLTLPFPAGIARDYDLQVTVIGGEGQVMGSHQSVRFALDYSIIDPDGNLLSHGIYQAPARDWDGTSAALAELISASIVAAADQIVAALPDSD